jgi:hypothetical protein
MTDERRRDEHAGDAAVDAAWRSVSRDEPPARLDATILAAARAETRRPAPEPGVPARRAWWTHWQPLAAAAGVAGLAFVLVQMIPRDEPLRSRPAVERASEADPPVAPPSGGPPAPGDGPAAEAGKAAPATASGARTETTAPARTVAEPVPAPAPAPARQESRAREAMSNRAAMDASAESTAPSGALAPTGALSPAAAPAETVVPAPDDWARHIAALHASGDLDAAAAQLREFRRAYADADGFLPDELRDWASAVPAPESP